MLDLFRRGGIVQILLGGIVLLLVAAFALDSRSNSSAGSATQCAVEVDGNCVPPRDFNAALRMSVRSDITEKQIQALGLRQIIMDGLVERELLLAEADRLGIGVTDEYVDAELLEGRVRLSMPAERSEQWPDFTYVSVVDPKTNRFNFSVYERSIRYAARMSPKDFKVHQRKELIAARMREFIKSTARFSDQEAYAQYVYSNEKATVRVADLAKDWFMRFGTSVDSEAVDAYLAANAEAVEGDWKVAQTAYTENCANLQQIVLRYPPAADAEDEAKILSLAQSLRKRLAGASAEQFARYARVYSAVSSGASGGYLGCVDAEVDSNKVLLESVESLQPGELSKVLALPSGQSIVRLDSRLTKEAGPDAGKRIIATVGVAEAAANQALEAFAAEVLASAAAGKTLQQALDESTSSFLARAAQSLPSPFVAEFRQLAQSAHTRPRVEISSSFARSSSYNPLPTAVTGVFPKRISFALTKPDELHPEPLKTRSGLALLQLKEKSTVTPESFENKKVETLQQLKKMAQTDALIRYVAQLRSQAKDRVKPNPAYLANATKSSTPS